MRNLVFRMCRTPPIRSTSARSRRTPRLIVTLAAQQSDQRRQHRSSLGIVRRNTAACRHQRSEFIVVNMRGGGMARLLGNARGSSASVRGSYIARYSQKRRTTSCRMARPLAVPSHENTKLSAMSRVRGPSSCSTLGYWTSSQRRGLLLKRVAERPTQRDVVFHLDGQCPREAAHDTPPGNGKATAASCGSATFT